jgi:hypothetical protein
MRLPFRALQPVAEKPPGVKFRGRIDFRDYAATTRTVDGTKRVQEQRTTHCSLADPVRRYGQGYCAERLLLDLRSVRRNASVFMKTA